MSREDWMGRIVPLLVLGGLLAGCSAAADREAAQLAQACQVSRCDCISNTLTFFDEEPIQWNKDGTAYCPEGYHLRRLETPPQKVT